MNDKDAGRTLAVVAFGANLGDVKGNIGQALALLEKVERVDVLKISSIWRTYPVGGAAGQPSFFNGSVLIETDLPPMTLLMELQKIEKQLKRERFEKWGPRTIDLDLILYGDLVINDPRLTLPHPRVYWRQFVLDPVCEIASELVLPTTGLTFRETRFLLFFNFRAFIAGCFLVRQPDRIPRLSTSS